MKKGTRLISKIDELEIIYVGKSKKDKECFKGVVVVPSNKGYYTYKVGHYCNQWILSYFKIK
jgi:hypothetical protein